MKKKKLPARKVRSELDISEDEISGIFPLQELKALLEGHGYTMNLAAGFRYEGTTENRVLFQLVRRIPGKDGINGLVGFARHD
jgi:hypothetical protein